MTACSGRRSSRPGGLVDRATCGRPGEARPSAATGLAGSPTNPNRQSDTGFTLRDGGSRLTGGLVSGNRSAGATGVPVPGRLPVRGRRFRTGAAREGRTESMVMSTPVVIAGHEDGGCSRGGCGSGSIRTPGFGDDVLRLGFGFRDQVRAYGGWQGIGKGHGGFVLPPRANLRPHRAAGGAGFRRTGRPPGARRTGRLMRESNAATVAHNSLNHCR